LRQDEVEICPPHVVWWIEGERKTLLILIQLNTSSTIKLTSCFNSHFTPHSLIDVGTIALDPAHLFRGAFEQIGIEF
jgi:hypothetical protein